MSEAIVDQFKNEAKQESRKKSFTQKPLNKSVPPFIIDDRVNIKMTIGMIDNLTTTFDTFMAMKDPQKARDYLLNNKLLYAFFMQLKEAIDSDE